MAGIEMSGEMPLAIVTGGNRGIGLSLVRQLGLGEEVDDIRYRVIATARNEEAVSELNDLMQSEEITGEASLLQLDRPEPGYIVDWYEEIVANNGGPSLLINNAADPAPGSLEELGDETIIGASTANYISPSLLIKHAAKHLRKNEGAVLNISSLAAIAPLPGMSPVYVGTKAAINMITIPLTGQGYRVNSLVLGAVDTRMWHDNVPDAIKPALQEKMHSGRPYSSEEVARAARRIVESGITGKIIHMNDGLYVPDPNDPFQVTYEEQDFSA